MEFSFSPLTLIVCLPLLFSCNKNDDFSDKPQVSTDSVKLSAYNTVVVFTSIRNVSTSATPKGVCWSTTSNPTIQSDKKLNSGTSLKFSDTLMNLLPSTQYYIRSYVTAGNEVIYSAQVTINTGTAPVYNQNFKWTYETIPYIADSSIAYLNGISNKPTILAWNKGSAVGTFKIAFALISFDLGGHILTATPSGSNPPPPTNSSKNLYYYDDVGNQLPVVNGAINFSSNTNGRLSGNFTANLLDANGAPKHVSGSFKDVPIKP